LAAVHIGIRHYLRQMSLLGLHHTNGGEEVKSFWHWLLVLLAIIVFCMLFGQWMDGQTLQPRGIVMPVEDCPTYVALSRHWLKDVAKVSPVKWHRDWLKKEYKRSFETGVIEAVCMNEKRMQQYDIDLSDVRLQMSYDIRGKRELKETK
jgi:hypothetical protein